VLGVEIRTGDRATATPVSSTGPVIARRLRRCRPRPSDRWHLDEMVVRIVGQRMYLWRAVDHEGEVLDSERRGNGLGVPFRDAPAVGCSSLRTVSTVATKTVDPGDCRATTSTRTPFPGSRPDNAAA
jgi:hypothetical protein